MQPDHAGGGTKYFKSFRPTSNIKSDLRSHPHYSRAQGKTFAASGPQIAGGHCSATFAEPDADSGGFWVRAIRVVVVHVTQCDNGAAARRPKVVHMNDRLRTTQR